jgi:hypothetical protein
MFALFLCGLFIQVPGLKYFLYEYELQLAEGQGQPVRVTWDDIEGKRLENTIEHILPQTANKRYWTSRFDKKARRKYTHDLGNLCLTYNNSSYGTSPSRRRSNRTTLTNEVTQTQPSFRSEGSPSS